MALPVRSLPGPRLPKENTAIIQIGDDIIQPIQGIMPDSLGEYWISRALQRLNHRFIFQYRILNTRNVKGAYVVDWLVLTTAPMSTPLEFFGEYWHSGQMGSNDRFRLSVIENHFQGRANPVEIIWSRDVLTKDDALDAVRGAVGVG